jgi:hypothetical protein
MRKKNEVKLSVITYPYVPGRDSAARQPSPLSGSPPLVPAHYLLPGEPLPRQSLLVKASAASAASSARAANSEQAQRASKQAQQTNTVNKHRQQTPQQKPSRPRASYTHVCHTVNTGSTTGPRESDVTLWAAVQQPASAGCWGEASGELANFVSIIHSALRWPLLPGGSRLRPSAAAFGRVLDEETRGARQLRRQHSVGHCPAAGFGRRPGDGLLGLLHTKCCTPSSPQHSEHQSLFV